MKLRCGILLFLTLSDGIRAQPIDSKECGYNFSPVLIKYSKLILGEWETEKQQFIELYDGTEKERTYYKNPKRNDEKEEYKCEKCCAVSLNIRRRLSLGPSSLFAAEGQGSRENTEIGEGILKEGLKKFEEERHSYGETSTFRSCAAPSFIPFSKLDAKVDYLEVKGDTVCQIFAQLHLTDKNGSTSTYNISFPLSNVMVVNFPNGPTRYKKIQ